MLEGLNWSQWQHATFANPWAFLLFLALPVLYWWSYVKRQKSSYFVMSSLAKMPQASGWKVWLMKSLKWWRMGALALLIIALAQPQKRDSNSWVESEGLDIMLCMDVSWSMMSEDFKPNRLAVAKELSVDFVNKREGDRIGLVVFSGESFLKAPITIDHNLIKEELKKLESGKLKDGTAIGDGLATSVDKLKDLKAKSKIVILMTDGEENEGHIKAPTALEIAKVFGVKIYTIGVGTEGKALMPVPQEDGSVTKVSVDVRIDEPLLQKIAQETGGKYYRAQSKNQLKNIYESIDKLEKTNVKLKGFANVTDLFQLFVLLALLLLTIEWVIKFGILKTIS